MSATVMAMESMPLTWAEASRTRSEVVNTTDARMNTAFIGVPCAKRSDGAQRRLKINGAAPADGQQPVKRLRLPLTPGSLHRLKGRYSHRLRIGCRPRALGSSGQGPTSAGRFRSGRSRFDGRRRPVEY